MTTSVIRRVAKSFFPIAANKATSMLVPRLSKPYHKSNQLLNAIPAMQIIEKSDFRILLLVLYSYTVTIICAGTIVSFLSPMASAGDSSSRDEKSVDVYSYDSATGKIVLEGRVQESELPKQVTGVSVPWHQNMSTDDLRCGVKALFAFLRLCHKSVDLDQLEKELNAGKAGVDMLQLKQVASDYGIETKVVDCSPDDLKEMLPAIVRLSSGTDSNLAHYIVASNVDDQYLYYIEPTTCRYEQADFANISRSFSGKAVALADSFANHDLARWSPLINGLLILVIVVQVTFIVTVWYKLHIRKTPPVA